LRWFTRGTWCAKDEDGSAVLQGADCHQDDTTAQGKVTGAPDWHPAPPGMQTSAGHE
jgi:hypothetical protein